MKPEELKDLKKYPYSHRRAGMWEMEVEGNLGKQYTQLQKLKEIAERRMSKNICFAHTEELLEEET